MMPASRPLPCPCRRRVRAVGRPARVPFWAGAAVGHRLANLYYSFISGIEYVISNGYMTSAGRDAGAALGAGRLTAAGSGAARDG